MSAMTRIAIAVTLVVGSASTALAATALSRDTGAHRPNDVGRHAHNAQPRNGHHSATRNERYDARAAQFEHPGAPVQVPNTLNRNEEIRMDHAKGQI